MRSFQQKLDIFKTKIQFQPLLAQSLSVEFESLKQLFDASLLEIGSTSSDFGVASGNFESALEDNGATLDNFGVTSEKIGVTSSGFDTSSEKVGVTSDNFESTSSVHELSALIRQSAGEFLKIHYSQPNIPGRMAEIVLALKEKERLSVAEMRQITGVSRNSLGRDLKVLKLLGWLEFHGSRKNGYFTLKCASFPGFQKS